MKDAVAVVATAARRLSREGPAGSTAGCAAFLEAASTLRVALNDGSIFRSLPGETRREAATALGEALSHAAAAGLCAARRAPLSPELVAAEADAVRRAGELYREAATVFESICHPSAGAEGAGQVEMAEATTAAANALAAWGELLTPPSAARAVLARAAAAYEAAVHLERRAEESPGGGDAGGGGGGGAASLNGTLPSSEDLLPALWNLADARVKCAECAGDAGDRDAARRAFDAAFETFNEACGRADSQAGDDLGGLLYDWGCGLVAAAGNLTEMVKEGDASRAEEAFHAARADLDAADEKLRHAAEFSPGAAEPLNALGEALQQRTELLRARANRLSFASAEAVVAAAAEVDAPLTRALAPDGGAFGGALRVDAANRDAMVGVAEVHSERGRVARWAAERLPPGRERDASLDAAAQHFRRGWDAFRRVLAAAANDAGDPGSTADRLGVVYNAACGAHLAGCSQDAAALLRQVISCGGATVQGVADDEDLRGLPPIG